MKSMPHTGGQKRAPLVHRVDHALRRHSRVYIILLLLGLVVFFNLVLFPAFHSINKNNESLDVQFSYSAEKAGQLLEKYSRAERRQYLIGTLTVDLVYPAVYSVLMSFLIVKLSASPFFALFPFLIMAADYLENLGIAVILAHYPRRMPLVVTLSSLATSLKWLLILGYTLMLAVLLALKLYRLLKKQRSRRYSGQNPQQKK